MDMVLCGETTRVQFKEVFTSQREIAKEMIALANSKGGMILFGVEDNNQFKVTIWRSIQKDDSTIQKDDSTIQKDDSTIQKNIDSSEMKVLEFFAKHPQATIDEAVKSIKDLSLGGVKFIIAKLQQKGLLKRVGGRKQGEWITTLKEGQGNFKERME